MFRKSPGCSVTGCGSPSNVSLAAPLRTKTQDPFVLVLVVPEPRRGYVAVGNDPLDPHLVVASEQARNQLFGQFAR